MQTLLIVDDESVLREFLISDFQGLGYKVLGAGSGRDAFEITQKEAVDLIITDMKMPDGDGLQLLKSVKTLQTKKMPVVFFISGFSDVSVEEAYEIGVSAVFPKPFDRVALHEAVKSALLPKDERWKGRPQRLDVSCPGAIHMNDLNMKSEGNICNVGLGGFFISLNETFPSPGSHIKFDFIFSDQNIEIQGTGVVRWVRKESSDGPAGCGVEFLQLEPESRRKLVEFINTLKTTSYIPKK